MKFQFPYAEKIAENGEYAERMNRVYNGASDWVMAAVEDLACEINPSDPYEADVDVRDVVLSLLPAGIAWLKQRRGAR